MKTNTGYNNCHDAFVTKSTAIHSKFSKVERENAESVNLEELALEIFKQLSAAVSTAEENDLIILELNPSISARVRRCENERFVPISPLRSGNALALPRRIFGDRNPDNKKVFETSIEIVSGLAGGNDFSKFFCDGTDEILEGENTEIVSVMGTGIETFRTTYARVGGRVVRLAWERSRQFMKWEYWLSLTSALRAADGDPEKLLDENFV